MFYHKLPKSFMGPLYCHNHGIMTVLLICPVWPLERVIMSGTSIIAQISMSLTPSPQHPWLASRLYRFFHAKLNWAQDFNCSLKLKYRHIKKCFAISLSDVVFILLIIVKIPTIVVILTFKSGINFMLIWVGHDIFFNTLGPEVSNPGLLQPTYFQHFWK